MRNRLKRGVSPLRDDYTNDAHAAMHTRTGLTPDAPHRRFFKDHEPPVTFGTRERRPEGVSDARLVRFEDTSLSTYAAASHASGIDLMMSESPGSVMDMHDTR